MAHLFISDLHLSARDPASIERFTHFVREHALGASSLYILGDLFDAWIGDDDTDPAMKPVIDALASVTKAGVPCRIMHGNHDFLIGRRFAVATGCELLGDYDVLELYGERVLLTHGDLLCTDDVRYQQLRAMVRSPEWQRDFLAKSLDERRAIASEIRRVSQAEAAEKKAEIMDVNPGAVLETMRRFEVRRLLHGHTHRPAVHRFDLDGEAAERIVLDAWHGHGQALVWDENGHQSIEF